VTPVHIVATQVPDALQTCPPLQCTDAHGLVAHVPCVHVCPAGHIVVAQLASQVPSRQACVLAQVTLAHASATQVSVPTSQI
jgi:hypothetical protein